MHWKKITFHNAWTLVNPVKAIAPLSVPTMRSERFRFCYLLHTSNLPLLLLLSRTRAAFIIIKLQSCTMWHTLHQAKKLSQSSTKNSVLVWGEVNHQTKPFFTRKPFRLSSSWWGGATIITRTKEMPLYTADEIKAENGVFLAHVSLRKRLSSIVFLTDKRCCSPPIAMYSFHSLE